MTKILDEMLSLDEQIKLGTDHYVNDIIVNESVVAVKLVKGHLLKYGLVTKEPVKLTDARVLGLRATESNGAHVWQRDGRLLTLSDNVTKRELFSVCGKLIGHYPIVGWLRVACGYMKQLASDTDWDKKLPKKIVNMLRRTLKKVAVHDPVKGSWSVEQTNEGNVWCDASSIAIGVCIEIGGQIVEDASWLRQADDGSHINVAAMDVVLKGINLAIKWNARHMHVYTDSATVQAWVNSAVLTTHRPKVTGHSEMIFRRRLGLITQLVDEYGLTVDINMVRSVNNCADQLTRVEKWLARDMPYVSVAVERNVESENVVQQIHNVHHLGVARTFYLAKRKPGTEASFETVERVVKQCLTCRRNDPAPLSGKRAL
ncbi:uncharacterized protein [Watersipora subatra]|uniref:uncharacterized protein n=1 Tax=Watersipora subatra TaxID=2589382 RepID=UPI00355B173C